jgi:hypothetical protein
VLSVVKENLVWLQDVFTTLINKTDPYHQKLAFFKANCIPFMAKKMVSDLRNKKGCG